MNPLLSTQFSSFTCHHNFFHHQVCDHHSISLQHPTGHHIVKQFCGLVEMDSLLTSSLTVHVYQRFLTKREGLQAQPSASTIFTMTWYNMYNNLLQQPSPMPSRCPEPFKYSHLQFNSDICQLNVVYLFFKCLL